MDLLRFLAIGTIAMFATITAMPEYNVEYVLRTLHDHDERHLHQVEVERHHQAHQDQQRKYDGWPVELSFN
jgi:NifB/MoaA-like Fe-S oxidoreductase